MENLKLLLVDDNPDDRTLVIHELQKEFPGLVVDQIYQADALTRALDDLGFDMVITDYRLNWSDGLEVLRRVRAVLPDCPVIMFTGTGTQEIAVQALKSGLDDYVVKSPQHFKRLPAAVRAALEKNHQRLALISSEEDFRRVIRCSPIAMAIYDQQERITFLNDRFIKIFGYHKDDIPDLDAWWRRACPDPNYLQQVRAVWEHAEAKARRTGSDIEPHRYRISCKDGTQRIVEIFGSLIGKKLLVIFNDITQQRYAVEQLLLMGAIVESSDDAIVGMDLEGTVTSWNRGAEKIYGYPRVEMIGRSLAGILPEGGEGELELILERTRRGEHIEHLETLHRRKDGKLINMSLTISPIVNAEGNVTSASTICSDISHRVSLEQQLRQAQKMEALGTLAGGIAHDFNNILTAIIGHASLLNLRLEKNSALSDNVHQILESASRAANLTQALLGFSRKGPLETKPVSLNGIIRKVERLLVMLLKENVSYQADLTKDDPTILADPGQIEQVLINLATNARDAIPSTGAIRVGTSVVDLDEQFVRAHGYGGPGRYASLSFSDNGVGMDERIRLRIFEPFFTTKDSGKGTGLGLAIVYGIVKQHNGFISCYSEPGLGTTFQIYLPISTRELVEKAQVPETPPRGGTETILVAEDDEATRKLDRKVLEAYGYRVIEAYDGEDAIAKFKEHRNRIQLLFLDSIMPKKNGKEVYEEVTRIAPGLKVLFTSGYTADTFSDLETREFRFIAKPILPTQLLKMIREALDGKPELPEPETDA
jgi:two-component system, cell cycle sensor histidine kinase and response regulator CckA